VEDPDAPMGLWIHWVVWNIPPTNTINENSVPGTEGLNTAKNRCYGGPCPPSGTHRYFFKVYALDAKLELSDNSTKKDVEKAMQGHVIAKGELMGVYSRSR
jgi:Raf kinase inhibitor-like YbhB/YbcL family protein